MSSGVTDRFGLMLKQKLSRRDVADPKLSDLMSCHYNAGRNGYKLFLFQGHVFRVAEDGNGPYDTGFVEADVEPR